MLEVGCPAVCLDEAAIREEIAPENRTGSQLKKVKKGASPDHTGVSKSPLPAAEASKFVRGRPEYRRPSIWRT